jgi:glycosyltransferase involved in cell wall biosynthesis
LNIAAESSKEPVKQAPVSGAAGAATVHAPNVVAVIPALNEAGCIGAVVAGIAPYVTQVVVVDNGSTDGTAAVAQAAGAVVVAEPQRGYGAACLKGIARARELSAAVVLFMDGDGSDDPADAPRLLAALENTGAAVVLGVRNRETMEPGAMAPVQQFGNWLAPFLLRHLGRTPYSDLPPFKAVRMATLEQLNIQDRGHGFTVELLLRAHVEQVGVRELPVRCLARRAGTSKVSGSIVGSARAGVKILSTVGQHVLRVRLNEFLSK